MAAKAAFDATRKFQAMRSGIGNIRFQTAFEISAIGHSTKRGNVMSKLMTISAAAILAASISSAAFAQAGGGNPNAAGPNSSGTGLVQPGTTSTGTATDAKPIGGRVGTTGMGTAGPNNAELQGNNGNSASGSNSL